LKRSRMRRLRACLAHTSSGRLGSASGPTTWLCLWWLDADRMSAAKAAGSGRESVCPVPEERSPRPKSPLMERRKAMRFRSSSCRKRCRKRNDTKVRLAALHAPHIEGANEAGLARALRGRPKSSPRAMRENECVRVNEVGCLKIESGMRNDARRFNSQDCHHRA